jgi:hypothetical protein
MVLNTGLLELHENKKNETIQQIKSAIETIRVLEGQEATVTAKKLVYFTELSRATLYKKHALKIWNPTLWENRYVKKIQIEMRLENKFKKDLQILQTEIESLSIENNKLKNHNKKLKSVLEIQKKRSEVYRYDIDELNSKHQKLLAECQNLHNKLVMHGIN